jgi:CHASE3 domain sensor protein
MKEFLRSVIEDPEYQEALRARMIAGKAAHMEQLATYYTLGKPQEQVQVQTSPSMSKMLLMALQTANEIEQERRQPATADSSATPALSPGD